MNRNLRHPARVLAAVELTAALGLIPGCGTSPADSPPAPKTLTTAQVKEMPLEESGDLSVRQNLSDPSRRAVVGRDTPVSTPARKPKGQPR